MKTGALTQLGVNVKAPSFAVLKMIGDQTRLIASVTKIRSAVSTSVMTGALIQNTANAIAKNGAVLQIIGQQISNFVIVTVQNSAAIKIQA